MQLKEYEDYDLLDRVVLGDEIALREIISRYYAKIYATCWRILKRGEDVDDCIQDIWFTVWRKGHTFDRRSKFSSWLYRVAANVALMRYRKNKACKEQLVSAIYYENDNEWYLNLNDAHSFADDSLTLSDPILGRKIVRLLYELPAEDREVLTTIELSKIERGQALGMGTLTAASRLCRARKKLRILFYGAAGGKGV